MRLRSALARACATALLCTLIGALTFALGAAELERGTRAEDVAAAQPARAMLLGSLAARLANAPRDPRVEAALRRDLVAAAADLVAEQRRLVDPRSDLHLERRSVTDAGSVTDATERAASLADRIARTPGSTFEARRELRARIAALAAADARIDGAYAAALVRLQSDVDTERSVAAAFAFGALVIEGIFVARPLRARFAARRRVAFVRATPSLRRRA